MKVSARFCQSLIEKELAPLSNIPFTLHGETRPSAEDLSLNPINFYYTGCEPDEYTGNTRYIIDNWSKYDCVLALNKEVLDNVPNAIFCPFGTSAFHDKLQDPVNEGNVQLKETKVTFIRGNKKFGVAGHQLRHELYNRRNEITNIKTEFYDRTNPEYASTPEEDIQWFAQRRYIFSSPMFHICIENTIHDNYFTEKIIDCFLFRTVPIYFGAPNIGSFFDDRGIIRFQSASDAINVCNSLTRKDYDDRIFEVYKNQVECIKYLNMGATIRETIKRIFQSKYPDYLKFI